MTPEELTRPLRIQLMDSSIRYLERKIETQQQKLQVGNAYLYFLLYEYILIFVYRLHWTRAKRTGSVSKIYKTSG